MENPPNNRLLSLLFVLAFLCLVNALNFVGQRNKERQQLCTNMYASITRDFYNAVSGKLAAQAASVYDFTKDKPVYSLNDTLPLPLASLTKLMTVRVAMKSVKEDALYTVIDGDVLFDGPTGFTPGDTYSVHDLLSATLVASSNNAANMLAHASGNTTSDFISLMNLEARDLGLASLHYGSVTGLDTDDLRATVTGSASDVLKLLYRDARDMPEIMALGTVSETTIHATNGKSIDLENTNDDLKKLGLLKASKTGYTATAGGNLAVLWQEPEGNTLGAVVLGSSISGRFTDILTLHSAADLYTEALRALPAYCSQ